MVRAPQNFIPKTESTWNCLPTGNSRCSEIHVPRSFSFLRILQNSRPSQNCGSRRCSNPDCHSRIYCFQNQIASFSRGEVLLILDKILSCQTFACSHTSVWRKRYFGPQEGSTSDFLDFASYRKKYKSAESLNAVYGYDLPKGTLWENILGVRFSGPVQLFLNLTESHS